MTILQDLYEAFLTGWLYAKRQYRMNRRLRANWHLPDPFKDQS